MAAPSDPQEAQEPVAPPEHPAPLLGLLKRRYFRRMWAVTSLSSVGDWLAVFALTSYVSEISGQSGFAVGGVLLFRVVPGLFFGPFAGVLADRFDRRRLMISADLMRAVLIGTIPWVHNLWGIYAVSTGLELLGLLWTPAKDATIPNLVERRELMMANQLSLITTYGTFPLSGAFVALLAIPSAYLSRFDAFSILKAQPTALAFFFDAATFLFSAAMVATFPKHLMVAKRARTTVTRWNPFHDLAEGLRFVRRHPLVRTLVAGAWTAFTGGAAIVALGPIFTGVLTGGSEASKQAAWGALIVAVGMGLVAGMIAAGALARFVQREHIFPLGLMVSGGATIVTATMTSIRPSFVSVVFIGLGAGVAWVTAFTLLQERVDDRLRGRTFATLYTGIRLSLVLGLAGWPIMAGLIGTRSVVVGTTRVDLSGFRMALLAGGVFLSWSGVSALRGIARTNGKRHSARMRGLQVSQPLSGGSRRGLFIVFEGGEGAGKSTQMKMLADFLRAQGREVVVTREPGGTPIAERIRHILLDPASKGMDPKTEAMLYAAARAQHVSDKIRPALEREAVVLSDRYVDSSLAYQGIARGVGETDVLRLNVWATDDLMPDMAILLHVDPEVGLRRVEGDPDRMEQEDIAFHRKVADAFLTLARQYPSRFAVVDAAAPVEQVQQQIRAAILPLLQEAKV